MRIGGAVRLQTDFFMMIPRDHMVSFLPFAVMILCFMIPVLSGCEDEGSKPVTPGEYDTGCPFLLGIGRTVLWNPSAPQTCQSTLDGIKEAGAESVRLSVNGFDNVVQATRNHILYCNKIGLKVLLNIIIANLPLSCYEEGTQRSQGDTDKKFYSLYPISKVLPEKYQEWINAFLEDYAGSGCKIDVIEVGNEICWAAFNPDLPITGGIVYDSSYSYEAIPEQIRDGIIRSGQLAAMTRAAARAVFGEEAPKVTLGSLNYSENLQYYANSGGCIVKPLTALQIVSGRYKGMPRQSVDYLSLVDGIAIHAYPLHAPWNSDFSIMTASCRMYLDWLMKGIPEITNLPVYMTEVGFRYTDAGKDNDWMRTKRFQAMLKAMKETEDVYRWAQAHVYSWDQGEYALYIPDEDLLLDAGKNIFK